MGVADEVIITLKLYESVFVLTDTVEIEVAVGLRFVEPDELTALVKAVVARGKVGAAHIVVAQIDAGALSVLMGVADEVVITLKLYESVCVLTDTVEVEVAVGLRSVEPDELTALVKAVVARGKVGAAHIVVAQIDAGALSVLMGVADEVVITLKLYESVCVLTDTVEVEVAVGLRSVEPDELTALVKAVVARGKVGAAHIAFAKIDAGALSVLMGVADEVIITLELYQSVCVLANIVQIEVAVSLRAVLYLRSGVEGRGILCVAGYCCDLGSPA